MRDEGAMMSDGRAYDDQGLPWLEAVDDEDGPRGVSARKMLVALLIVAARRGDRRRDLVLARPPRRRRSTGAPELIRAEPGPYKVKPDDPGGLDVAGESETAFETSAGEDPDAALDMDKLAAGVDRRRPRRARRAGRARAEEDPAQRDQGAARPTTPPRRAPGPTIQLGAYASTIKADTAWGMLSGRFPEVAALTSRWSARRSTARRSTACARSARPTQTRAACAALKAAGESCLVVN